MRVAVVGLWHLGSVTAAGSAAAGHAVTGYDPDPAVVAGLNQGRPPLFEPGLAELVQAELAGGRLRFTTDPVEAVAGAEVVWVTFDTPVDADDQADVAAVTGAVAALFPHLPADSVVLLSAQVPAGTTGQLEAAYRRAFPNRTARFAYSPENLRLGQALRVFQDPDRVVAGVRDAASKAGLARLFAPITDRIEWMSVESAEMTKHALNAFLATSVAFMNEIAILCERTGADAREVERGLKSEARIGPKAYLRPGAAFAGGTLARDIQFLSAIGDQTGEPVHLLRAVRESNRYHQDWVRRQLAHRLAPLAGKTVALWGLTYKPGTDTLRRSSAVELARWLADQGVRVQAHDPAVKQLPAELASVLSLIPDPLAALAGADALVVATEWPDYREIPAAILTDRLATPLVIDPGHFLASSLAGAAGLTYLRVGTAVR